MSAPMELNMAQSSANTANISLDFLEQLTSLTPSFDLEALVDSSIESFRNFGTFYKGLESSGDPSITVIVADLAMQFTRYCDAIDDSMTTAQHGYTFATDGVDLCDFIEQEKSVEELTLFISDMSGLAKETAEKAKLTVDQFRSVRIAVYEIHKSIPQSLAIASSNTALEHPFEVSRLIQGTICLEGKVSNFADWWLETETKLKAVRKIVQQLRPQRVNKLRLITVRKGWEDVGNRYLKYLAKIAQLRDAYEAEHNFTAEPTLLIAAEKFNIDSRRVHQITAGHGSDSRKIAPQPPIQTSVRHSPPYDHLFSNTLPQKSSQDNPPSQNVFEQAFRAICKLFTR